MFVEFWSFNLVEQNHGEGVHFTFHIFMRRFYPFRSESITVCVSTDSSYTGPFAVISIAGVIRSSNRF